MGKRIGRMPIFRIIRVKTVLILLSVLLAVGCKTSPPPQPYKAPEGAAAASGRPIVFMTATELAGAIRAGRLTSVEVVTAFINHIHK